MIEYVRVYKSFSGKQVLKDVNVRIRKNEIFFIVGQSGVGKSVMIKMIIGLLHPTSGKIYVDGEDITGLTEREFLRIRKKCGMVFQHSTLFDSLNVVENVVLPLRKHRKLSGKQAMELAMEYLSMVRMERFAYHYPSSLGDGMKKQVAIARTLTMQPEYVLFDEPTTGLDPISARRVDNLIKELSQNLGVTSVVVSHDLKSIFSVADRIMMLYKGEVRKIGKKEEFMGSADPVVRQFVSGQPEGPMET